MARTSFLIGLLPSSQHAAEYHSGMLLNAFLVMALHAVEFKTVQDGSSIAAAKPFRGIWQRKFATSASNPKKRPCKPLVNLGCSMRKTPGRTEP